jgi:6-phosphogluconate dehydrogenase
LIAETYDLMKRRLGLNDDEPHDAYSPWLPANLIQAQRDYFGAHTYERIDAKGTFHTEWEKN